VFYAFAMSKNEGLAGGIEDGLVAGNVSIGTFLRMYRLRNEVSLRGLDALSGVGYTEIHQIENGQQDIRVSSLIKLCAALGVPCGRLLDDNLGSHFQHYSATILREAEFQTLLKELGVSSGTILADDIAANLGACCGLAVTLVQCSFAQREVKLIAYPNEDLRRLFFGFAKRVDEISEPLERVGITNGFRTAPMKELINQGLLSDSFARQVSEVNGQPRDRAPELFFSKDNDPKKPFYWCPFIPRYGGKPPGKKKG
jgi:transcriptional regulator with XRE-family HTH domain